VLQQQEAGVFLGMGKVSGAEAAARLVQRNSRGTAIARKPVQLLRQIGAMGIVQVLPAPHALKSSLGIAALKGNALRQQATGARQETAHMDTVQTLNAQAAT